MSDSQLTIGVKAEGAEEAKKSLQSVAGEVENLQKQTEGAATSTKGQADATKQSHSSWSQLVGLIRSVNPELGGYVDAMLKAAQASGALKGESQSLGQIFGGLLEKFSGAGAGSLKLAAALGAAGIALSVLKASWDAVQQSIAAAREEQERFIEGQNRMQAGKLDTEDAVRGVALKQRESVSVDDLRRASTQAKRLTERGISNATAAAIAGGYAGPDLAEGGALGSIDDLETLARAVDQGLMKAPDPRQSREFRTKRARRALEGRIGREVASDSAVEREVERDRMKELQRELERGQFLYSPIGVSEFSTGGGTEHLERMIKKLRGDEFTDEDRRKLARLVQMYEALRASGASEEAAQAELGSDSETGWNAMTPGLSHASKKMAADAASLHAAIRAQIWRRTGGGEHGATRATPQWMPDGPSGSAIMDFRSGRGESASAAGGDRKIDVGGMDIAALFARLDHASRVMMQAAEAQRRAMEAQANTANHRVGVTPPRNWATRTGADAVIEAAEG